MGLNNKVNAESSPEASTVVEKTQATNESHIASCKCRDCGSVKDKFRDLLIEKLIETLNGLDKIYKKLLRVISAILSSIVFFILVQITYKIEFFNTLWLNNIMMFIRSLPEELFIILGFLFASMAAPVNEWAEIIFLFLIGLISAYWAFSTRQWFAFAAALFMIFYSLVRTNLLNKSVDVYFLSFFKHSLIVIFTLLAVNFILKLTKL